MAIQQTMILERALQLAADRHATDLFLVPNEPVALRLAGRVERMDGPVLTAGQVREIATAAIGAERVLAISGTGPAVTSCGLEGIVSGWMCVGSTRGDLTIVVRILLGKIPDLKSISLPAAVRQAAAARSGLMLFTGPPACGKTTSMLSLLDNINAGESRFICTVEDPINAMLSSRASLVQQQEVGVDVPDTFSGIAAAVRSGADVLYVGELRNVEEVRASVTAARLGRLVITQLHTPTPEASIQRLIDIQPPEQVALFRRDLAQSLRCVTSQWLFERADGKGHVAAYGVLMIDDEMRRAIAEGHGVLERSTPLPAGSQSLCDEIERLRHEGVISEATAAGALEAIGVRG